MGGKRSRAAVVWRAAADARAWAATIVEHTAWTVHTHGWEARNESNKAMGRAAKESRGMVDARNRMSADAMAREARELGSVAEMMKRAAAAFGRSSDLNTAAVAHLRRAARAYRRAGCEQNAEGVDKRIEMSSEYAETAARLRREADGVANHIGPLASALAAAAARMGEDGREWGGRPDELASSQSEMLAMAKKGRKNSAAWVENSRKAAELTAMAREMTEAAAKRSAAAAAAFAKDPRAEKAAAAWRRAMKAANRAADDDAKVRK